MGFFTRTNGDDPAPGPKGKMIEIRQVTDEEIWKAGGSVTMDRGKITGRDR